MTDHDDSHARWLERLALGELPRDVPESRALLECPRCAGEARDLLELAERLAAMDRTRDSILGETADAECDPGREARARISLEQAKRRSHADRSRRRTITFLVAVAATVLIGLAISIWQRAGQPASDGRGELLGTEHLELASAGVGADGQFVITANRSPRAGFTLSFVVISSPTGDSLGTFSSPSAACTIPKERTAAWPESVDIYVQECDGANNVLTSSPPRSWSPRH